MTLSLSGSDTARSESIVARMLSSVILGCYDGRTARIVLAKTFEYGPVSECKPEQDDEVDDWNVDRQAPPCRIASLGEYFGPRPKEKNCDRYN